MMAQTCNIYTKKRGIEESKKRGIERKKKLPRTKLFKKKELK